MEGKKTVRRWNEGGGWCVWWTAWVDWQAINRSHQPRPRHIINPPWFIDQIYSLKDYCRSCPCRHWLCTHTPHTSREAQCYSVILFYFKLRLFTEISGTTPFFHKQYFTSFLKDPKSSYFFHNHSNSNKKTICIIPSNCILDLLPAIFIKTAFRWIFKIPYLYIIDFMTTKHDTALFRTNPYLIFFVSQTHQQGIGYNSFRTTVKPFKITMLQSGTERQHRRYRRQKIPSPHMSIF